MEELIPCSHSTAYMALGFIEFKQPANLDIQLRADGLKALCDVFVYGRLRDAKLLGRCAHGRTVFRYVLREPDGPLLDVSPHLHHSRHVVLNYMTALQANMRDYIFVRFRLDLEME